jgi:hypothetical protein
MQQMGGMGNIMNMMKEMGNMEGMQDMMSSMMGGAGGVDGPLVKWKASLKCLEEWVELVAQEQVPRCPQEWAG